MEKLCNLPLNLRVALKVKSYCLLFKLLVVVGVGAAESMADGLFLE